MKKITQISLVSVMVLIAVSCSDSKKDGNSVITEKKTQLAKLKNDKTKTEEEIKKLETELAAIDTATANAAKIRLVGVTPVSTHDFQHYIDLQGKVDADNISYISPRGMPGQVKEIYVRQGQMVKKGQLLLKLDDAIAQQNVIVARQQLQGIKARLNLSKSLYERRQNLWDKGIGTQVEVLQAKTEVESLDAQLSGANEQVRAAVVQANTTNVYSDVSGVADVVNIRVGETFTGMAGVAPQIKIVNTSSLKVVSNVPENYISRMKTGTPVVISIPDAGKNINSSISLISQSIDPTQRGFIAEAKIPADAVLKPNQSAIMKILDYSAANAVVIPVNVVQSDETSKYVYVLEKLSNGRTIAKKKQINIGEVYGDLVEIKTGLSAGEQLITEGYQNLYEGQLVGTGL
jgi:RND family efflux transporter MFP subunit